MSSDFGLKGPKTPWVCPNDRALLLRAKLRAGWSVKTSTFSTYPKPQPLTESEQQMIISVVKKAEELDLSEQKRVGKLVDRLESLKKLASGNGISDCILCGDSFGLSVFGRTNFTCSDCKKAVCRKCVVELSVPNTGASSSSTSSKDSVVRLCKICSENRELIKRSGAWFYKGVPKYILPEKKNHYRNNFEPNSSMISSGDENRYRSRYLNSHVIGTGGGGGGGVPTPHKRMGVFWSRGLTSGRSQSEGENDSSSDEATTSSTRKTSVKKVSAAAASAESNDKKSLVRSMESNDSKNLSTSPSNDSKSLAHSQSRFQSPTSSNVEDHLYEISDGSNSLFLQQKSFEKFDPSGSFDQTVLSDNTTRSSGSSSNDCLAISSTTTLTSSSSSILHSPYGTIEITLLYDDAHQALHCTIHNAKDLTPMDINGLSDPFCVLKLIPARFQGTHHRTKTVHKTLNPVFNETLTFYGFPQSQLAYQMLQINVIDDDRWGRDCLGFLQIPLHRIRPQQTRSFHLNLEKGKFFSNNEDKEWGRGSLLLSLSYLTEKSCLLVGVVRAHDLPALDHISGLSDPFVKVRLVHDTNLGNSAGGSSHFLNRKFKTGIRWKTLNPEFNEEFSFKVSVIDLPHLALIISVWDKDLGKTNDYIGGVVLSYGSKGERLKHWSDMIKLPNIKHTKWHHLCSTPTDHATKV